MPQISRRSRAMMVLAVVVAMVASLFTPGLSGVAGAAPLPPTGLLPNGGAFTANPSLTWNPVATATEYRVLVCPTTPCTTSNDVWTADTINTTATPPDDLPMGTIHWSVAARDASGYSQPATASFTKSQSGPQNLSPVDTTVLHFPSEPPTLTWQAQQGARSYLLEIDDEPNFVNPTSIVTDNPSHTLDSTQTLNKEYFWRVRSSTSTNPKSASAILSDWSPQTGGLRYTVEWPNPDPMLVAPPNTTVAPITDIELKWNPVPGAARYRLQVNRNIDFSGQFVENRVVYGTHYSPLETYDNGSYHWRVAPIDANNNEGNFSETFSFRRDWTTVPPLAAPSNGELNLNPLAFSWSPVDHAAYYEVQVGTDENFSPNTFKSCYTNHTLLKPYSMFQGSSGAPGGCPSSFWTFGHGQTYFWRVRGIDADADILGFYSPVWSFIRRIPIPTRTSPANGATVATPVLTWNKVVGAQQYLVTIVDNEGSEVVKDEETWATTYTPHKKLDPAKGPFRWYVRTSSDDGDGVIPSLASASVFNVSAPSFAAQPNLLTPANNSSSVQMPSMTWNPVENATEYEIWYSVAGSGTEAKLDTPKLENAGFTFTGSPLPNNAYDVYVRAYNGNSLISFGNDRRINIIDFQPVTQTSPPDCPPGGGGCQQVTQMPDMAWNDQTDARFYLVYLAFDPNFTNIIKVYEVPQLSMIPREELADNDAGQAYYWHVRPCKSRSPYRCGPDPQGVASPPERAFQKRSDPVELVSPTWNATVGDQPHFVWEDYLASNSSDLEAAEYRIQVATNPAFTSPIDDKRVDQTVYTPYDRTYPEGPIYWRVRAIDGSGNELTWSVPSIAEQGMFNKSSGAPTMQTPTPNQNVNGQPTFSWLPQPFAESYVLEVYQNGNDPVAPGNRVLNASTDHTQFTPSDPLPPQAPGVPYAWRIRREDGQGKDGQWSDLRKFTITEAAPTLTAPAQNATVTNDQFVFSWTPLPRAATYRLQSSNNGFANLRENVSTVMTAWAPTNAYPPGAWQWRVQALDANDQVIGTSNIRNFTRLNVNEAPSNVRVTNGRGTATVRWDPPAQMPNPPYIQYRVTLTGGPTGTIVRTVSASTFSLAFNGLINGQAYDVKVVGVASGGAGPANSNVVTALPNGCVGTPFNDVPAAGGTYPFCNDIAWLSTTGITQGTVLPNGMVLYKPGDGVSRMAMAAFLYRFAGSPPVSLSPQHFADVNSGHPFYKEIQWMWASGNSTGTPNPPGKPLYKPNDGVSREAMGAFLWRFAGTPAVPPGSPQFFADVNATHPFYQGIQWMYFSGVSTGTPNPPGKPLYKPTNVVTREAMAAFLHRLDGVMD